MRSFLETLKEQRWDDHRYYHHSRINQTLHLLSATSFLCAYVLWFSKIDMRWKTCSATTNLQNSIATGALSRCA